MKNKLTSIFMLVSFLPLALQASGQMKKNSKVILSGNILANSQIVPVGGQAKTVMASGSGKIRFSSTRFCGDGDVAHYAEEHPDTVFYDSGNPHTNIIVGYFISPQDGPLDISADKFFSIGYVKDSKVDADVTEKLIPVNFSSMPAKNTFDLINDAVKDVATIASLTKQSSVQGLSKTKFNMKFVAMACPEIKNKKGVDSSTGINNLKITRQFLTGNNLVGSSSLQDYMHDNILESNGSISNTRMQVNDAGAGNFSKSIDLQFGSSGSDSLASELVSLVNDLATATKPSIHTSTLSQSVTSTTSITCNCDKLDYQTDLAGLKARFEAFKTRFNAAKGDLTICDASSSIRFDSNDYPWESFRTNAACQLYHKMLNDELSSFESALNEMFSASDTNKNTCPAVQSHMASALACPGAATSTLTNISDSEYRSRKVNLNRKFVKIVGTPNAVQMAQNTLKSYIATPATKPNFALNTASCFPTTASTGEFIKYVGSSVGIHFNPDPDVAGRQIISIDTGAVIHPEGNFAIGGDAPYLTAQGNMRTLFNNGSVADPKLDQAFKVELGMSSGVTLSTGTANVQFHIRSIGCSQNVYCLNDR